MSDKPCLYAVLGVPKDAKPEQIKKAAMMIVIANHPDKVKRTPNATEATIKAAAAKVTAATDARDILLDANLRSTYDKYGHAGLERMKGSTGTNNPASSTSTIKPVVSAIPTRTVDESFSYFDNLNRNDQRTTKPADKKPAETTTTTPLSGGAEARRQAWLRKQGGGAPTTPVVEEKKPVETRPVIQTPVTKPVTTTPVRDTFKDVSDKVVKAGEKLREATVPLDALEEFRDNLQSLMDVVDESIRRARKADPGFGQ